MGQQYCPSRVRQVYSGSTVQDSGLPTRQGCLLLQELGAMARGCPGPSQLGTDNAEGCLAPEAGS